ncbi:hypothetical protein ACSFB8_07645 [Enterococcus faecalis]
MELSELLEKNKEMVSILPISFIDNENNEKKAQVCIEIYELLRKSKLPLKDVRAICKSLDSLVCVVHNNEPLPNYFKDCLDL